MPKEGQLSRNLLPRPPELDASYSNPDSDQEDPDNKRTKQETFTAGFVPDSISNWRNVFLPMGPIGEYQRKPLTNLIVIIEFGGGQEVQQRPGLKSFCRKRNRAWCLPPCGFIKMQGQTLKPKLKFVTCFQVMAPVFMTPKPERLIKQVLSIASDPGDLILDSFLGSATTAATAHKMGRRYIGIEMGDHAKTHCVPRLKKVVEGEQSGISESVNWKGGGGFRFCTLGQTAFDADGRINPEVRFNTLASFIWHFETATPAAETFDKPLLGVHEGKAYYLLYNGILGDKRPNGGNVLTRPVLQMLTELHPHDGPKIIYGETTRLGDASLAAESVTFQQIPRHQGALKPC